MIVTPRIPPLAKGGALFKPETGKSIIARIALTTLRWMPRPTIVMSEPDDGETLRSTRLWRMSEKPLALFTLMPRLFW